MTTTTMDLHGHAPAPKPARDGRLKELAAGIGYLMAIGTSFTGILSAALVALVGE